MPDIKKIQTPDGTVYDVRDDSKQEQLVSGTNIRTINGRPVLGSGNLVFSGSALPAVDAYSEGDIFLLYDNENGISVQASKSATPSSSAQTIVPDSGYTVMSQVVVNSIPYAETSNTYGTTVTIG